jgi:hypothetical protein
MQIGDLRVPPGNRLEKLQGKRLGQHSIRINDQYRICFRQADIPLEVAMSSMDVPLDIFTSIEREISSETSPVGIDAKKTHIIILHKLQEIDERLRRIEDRL